MPDLKPRLGSYTTSGLASLSRSPALPHPTSPISARDIYGSATPNLRRTDHFTRSPSLSGTLRGVPLSPTSTSGFTSPIGNMDGSLGGSACPPLFPTEVIYSLQTSDGQIIKPEIFGRIDKGFFMADNDWTCYRRNYFSLNCSYTLTPTIPTGSMYLVQHGVAGPQVNGFAMSIAAVVDGKDGKAIELVQHTPKRDKGPQEKPARIQLAPRASASHAMYGDSGRSSLYDPQGFNSNPSQPAVEATFERIQFKNATANNGKRRAAQQYYHLLVELFADIGGSHSSDRWVKIASRMSAQMVVRGRSPGHYQSERRGSNTSSGPGGSGGGGAGSYTPSGGAARAPGDMSMSGSSSMLSGPGYSNSYDNRSHHYRSHIAPLQIPMEPTLSAEEAKGIVESPDYVYYPGAIYEGHEDRFLHLPSMAAYTTSKVKSEYGSGGYVLPSLTSSHGGDGVFSGSRHCGRWEGMGESKGYFPTALMQQELNIT
ncbi:NDT80/PhoG like DNA-binding family protein-like protein [Acephala macrosclerotiorum]|nr:NDT80/PhoG like DNA-binding family protein-like protein [Acephala macrosclerotiorum]